VRETGPEREGVYGSGKSKRERGKERKLRN